jgi:hypothetical protein
MCAAYERTDPKRTSMSFQNSTPFNILIYTDSNLKDKLHQKKIKNEGKPFNIKPVCIDSALCIHAATRTETPARSKTRNARQNRHNSKKIIHALGCNNHRFCDYPAQASLTLPQTPSLIHATHHSFLFFYF